MNMERNIFRPEDQNNPPPPKPRKPERATKSSSEEPTQTLAKREKELRQMVKSDEVVGHKTTKQREALLGAMKPGDIDEFLNLHLREMPEKSPEKNKPAFMRHVMAEVTQTSDPRQVINASEEEIESALDVLSVPPKAEIENQTEKQILERYGLRLEDAAKSPEELELKNQPIVGTHPIERGGIKGKEVFEFEKGQDGAIFKALGTEFVYHKDGTLKVFRPGKNMKLKNGKEVQMEGIKPGTYMLRERMAYLIDQKFGFKQVPVTILKTRSEKAENQNIGSMQKWIKGKELRQKGSWMFPVAGRYFESKIKKGDTLAKEEVDTYESYKALKHEFIKKAVADLVTLNADVCTHPGNVMVDDDPHESKLGSIDNSLIFYHPFLAMQKAYPTPEDEARARKDYSIPQYIRLDLSSIITKVMAGEEIPQDILDSLGEMENYIDSGEAKKDWGNLLSKMENSFDELAYMKSAIRLLREKKKVLTLMDVITDSEAQKACLPAEMLAEIQKNNQEEEEKL